MSSQATGIGQKLRMLWNHPAGPKTIHFWAPTFKWGISMANIAGALARLGRTIMGYVCIDPTTCYCCLLSRLVSRRCTCVSAMPLLFFSPRCRHAAPCRVNQLPAAACHHRHRAHLVAVQHPDHACELPCSNIPATEFHWAIVTSQR
jgi:hypothetical protein